MGGKLSRNYFRIYHGEEKDIGSYQILLNLHHSVQQQPGQGIQVLGQMSRSFHYRDKYTWIRLYKVDVRPHLEYAVQAWSPWRRENIDKIENVQRKALKMTSGLKGQTYEQRLLVVNLTPLEDRRLRGDLIQTWKI